MSVTFRTYQPEPLFGEDYHKLRRFLVRLDSHNYSFGRWDWMITHGNLDPSGLPKIGLWEDGGEIVAAATYDCSLGQAYLPALRGYAHLSADMIEYAQVSLAKDGKFGAVIADGDGAFQSSAARAGLIPTQDKECDAVFPIGEASTDYTLPDGFSVTSMRDTFDVERYGRALWKGFNHEAKGEGPFVFLEEDRPIGESKFKRPNVNLDLKIAVVAPNGDFASYCGMWCDENSPTVLVEPVATDPAYRRMGLGRAAVLEAVKRCGRLGAKRALVGSSQQFYYSIGFRPYATSTVWRRR